MNRFNLPVFCLVAFSTSCAIDPPQQKSGVTTGCAGAQKSSGACLGKPGAEPTNDDALGNKNNAALATPTPTPTQAPTAVPTNTTSTTTTNSNDPLGGLLNQLPNILGALNNGGSGNNNPQPTPTPSGQTATPTPSGMATPAPTTGPQPATSVTLTATSGVYFKKNYNTSTATPSSDFCLVGFGTNIKASCVSSYTDTVYYVTGANACSGFTSGYIFKSSVSVVGTVSSSCR